jgi:long-chain acyl-CoA synthetase
MATTESVNQIAAPPLLPFENDTIPKIFFHGVDRTGGSSAMQFNHGAGWQPISHAEVEQRVSRLAAALDWMGVQRGDRVAILSENRPEWAIADFAVLGLGAADVPIYPTLPANQIAYILRDAGVRGIFVSTREQLAKLLEIRPEVPSLKAVIAFDDPGGAENVERFEDVLARGRELIEQGKFLDFRNRALTVGPDDLATLIYTSGTTGEPKGVMLTHYNIASNVAAVRQHNVLEIHPGEVALSFLPLSHSFERMADYYYWNQGATIAYVDAVEKVAESLVQVRPHIVAAAPRVFEKIYAKVMGATGVKGLLVKWAKRVGEATVEDRLSGRVAGPTTFQEKLADRLVFSKLRARTGGRIRSFVSGSAPLSADIARFFWAAGLRIFEGYGLTETSPVVNANKPGAVKLGTVGPPVPGTEIRIGENGEILARGPQIMKGYWNQPEATAEVIEQDGWFHTGDVGFIDPQGFLTITDRIKNILVTAGGKNIAPAPIENLVSMSPHIAQVVMLGDKRAFPTLLLVPDFENLRTWAKENGIEVQDLEALAEHPRVKELLEQEAMGRLQGLARYELPKKISVIPREFTVETGELTPTMKVKRKVVEEHYSEVIEEMYRGS